MENPKLRVGDLPRSVELVRDGDGGVAFRYIDERLLPDELRIERTCDWRAVIEAVKSLAVRGAPAIGLAGASALALWAAGAEDRASMVESVRSAREQGASDPVGMPEAEGLADMREVAEKIASARPTAVNLRWAVRRALREVSGMPSHEVAPALYDLVKRMEHEDEEVNRAIGAHGAELLGAGSRILTHCNAGSLATGYFGTALGVVYTAAAKGKVERVYADETRPIGQGARLTVWELSRAGVPTTLICDDMAASLMATGRVDAVIVGADRIARNGDVANKIGTYGVAVLAREHGIPFYVAAPTSTFDGELVDGRSIPIEQRDAREVLPAPIPGVDVWNPAFDVTPARLVTAIVTENGVYRPEGGELHLGKN